MIDETIKCPEHGEQPLLPLGQGDVMCRQCLGEALARDFDRVQGDVTAQAKTWTLMGVMQPISMGCKVIEYPSGSQNEKG